MNSREYDRQLRGAATIAGTSLISGFVGVSAGTQPDSFVSAGSILFVAICMIAVLMNVVSSEDWTSRRTIGTLIGGFALAGGLGIVTSKWWLSVGLSIAWVLPIFLYQRGPSAYKLEDTLEKMNQSAREMVEAAHSLQIEVESTTRRTRNSKDD